MLPSSKLALMIVTATAAIVTTAAPARAQGGSSAVTPTSVPINSGTFAKFMKASSNFAAYMKEHPADADLGDSSYDNANEAAKGICGPRPGVQQAIAAAGLTCVQWITLSAELQRAGSAAAIVKSGEKMPPEFAVSASDIDFYNKHTAEIQRALQEISAGTGSQ
jgi:hypothetical protein